MYQKVSKYLITEFFLYLTMVTWISINVKTEARQGTIERLAQDFQEPLLEESQVDDRISNGALHP